MDIHNKEFKRRGRHGYDRYEVDHFLDKIVDDYGDVLDQVVDLKNKEVALNKEKEQLQNEVKKLKDQVKDYEQSKAEVNEVLVSAQKSANQIKNDAQKKADQELAAAKQEADTDINYAKQQREVLLNDYKRLKEEVGGFRTHLQKMLQQQIDNLTDDEWQHALDKYFKTERYYPEDGSEPIPEADDEDYIAPGADEPDQISPEDLAAAEKYGFADEDEDEKKQDVDKQGSDEVDSEQAPDQAKAKPLAGDSPSHETVNTQTEPTAPKNSGATIIFPDDYKDHN